jgi:uncharacterized protein YheU (UPF0270 family)
LSTNRDVIIVPEDDFRSDRPERQEDGVTVPFERIDPETLRNLIAEFVTREWDELGESVCSLDDKIDQVQSQLRQKKARVVFDLKTNSCNIVLIP